VRPSGRVCNVVASQQRSQKQNGRLDGEGMGPFRLKLGKKRAFEIPLGLGGNVGVTGGGLKRKDEAMKEGDGSGEGISLTQQGRRS